MFYSSIFYPVIAIHGNKIIFTATNLTLDIPYFAFFYNDLELYIGRKKLVVRIDATDLDI